VYRGKNPALRRGDAVAFGLDQGPPEQDQKELADWRGNRADAGRLAHGLPKSNKLGKPVE
jgi:topoisomerase-4 subunit A